MEERESISEVHGLGAPLAALGAFLLYRRAMALPDDGQHSLGRYICLILACALVAYVWAVLVATLARNWDWSPQTCRAAGYALLALGGYGLVTRPHGGALFDFGGWMLLAEFTGRLCRYIAYPELGWKDPPKNARQNPPTGSKTIG
jgi:hypothetical protein